MNLRLANDNDLAKVKAMYRKIIDNMNSINIGIWDEIYPCEFFKDDIDNNRLYLLTEENYEIVGAFALCESNTGESYVQWENKNEKALYIDRVGVNVDYLRQGIGSILLQNALKIAKEKDAKYLRVFVVDINKPAENLYLKNNFRQVDGIYEEKIDDELTLREYGFEIEVR